MFIAVGRLLSFIKRKTLRPGGKRARALALGTPPAGTRTHTQDALQFALCTHTVVGSVRDSLYTLRAHTDHQLASPLFALSPHSLHTQERVAKIAHHKRASPTHVAHTQLSSHRRSGVLSLRALRCSLQKPLSIRTRGYQGRASPLHQKLHTSPHHRRAHVITSARPSATSRTLRSVRCAPYKRWISSPRRTRA